MASCFVWFLSVSWCRRFWPKCRRWPTRRSGSGTWSGWNGCWRWRRAGRSHPRWWPCTSTLAVWRSCTTRWARSSGWLVAREAGCAEWRWRRRRLLSITFERAWFPVRRRISRSTRWREFWVARSYRRWLSCCRGFPLTWHRVCVGRSLFAALTIQGGGCFDDFLTGIIEQRQSSRTFSREPVHCWNLCTFTSYPGFECGYVTFSSLSPPPHNPKQFDQKAWSIHFSYLTQPLCSENSFCFGLFSLVPEKSHVDLKQHCFWDGMNWGRWNFVRFFWH